jgi:uncharacterized membrane protein
MVAGAAGAFNLCQSDRNSLVSGAATGILVAASLAPPAGMVGMATAIGEWEMVRAGAFVLLLQFAGINLAGAIVFRVFGLSPNGVRYARGRVWVGVAAWLSSLAALVALLGWQFSDAVDLQRSTLAQRAAAIVQATLRESGLADPVSVDVRFTSADAPNRNTLLVRAYAQTGASGDEQAVGRDLSEMIQERLKARFEATPLVDVTVLRSPRAP